MRRLEKRSYFRKLDRKDSKWTHGRACVKLPGRVIVTPTNFKNISHLDIDEYSYNFYCRHSNVRRIPQIIAEEYFYYKYLKNRDSGKNKEFHDLEFRHLNETRTFMTYEYDLYVLKMLQKEWDPQRLRRYLLYYKASPILEFQRTSYVYTAFTAELCKQCSDSTLVVDYFRTICTNMIASESIFMGSTTYLRLFLEHSHKTGYDPWTLLRKYQGCQVSPVVEFCPVEWSLIQGKLDHLKLLLKYGCPFSVSNYTATLFNKKIDGRWWNRNRPIPIVMPGNPPIPRSSEDPSFRESSTFLAHFTVVMYLTANTAVIFGSTESQRFADCICIFMRSVPEAYVSYDDMLVIIGQLAPCILKIVTLSCEWYKTVFPKESSIGRRPRSLMHLSRCVIRQVCSLPDGVAKLPLPEYLKSYLNLDW